MNRTTPWKRAITCHTVTTVMLLTCTANAEAGLIGSYDWVAYNNSAAGAPVFSAAPPTVSNVTDFTIDTAIEGPTNTSSLYSGGTRVTGDVGDLVRFADGTDTGVDYSATIVSTGWHGASFRSGLGSGLVSGTVAHDNFGDIVGTNYALNGAYQNDHSFSTSTLTFTNLDPTRKYSFAALSTQIEWGARGTGGFSKVSLINDDATGGFLNNTTQSPFMSVGGVAGGNLRPFTRSGHLATNLPTLTTEWNLVNANLGTSNVAFAFLTGHSDDMIRFDEIMPGPDGIFSIRTETFMAGRLDGPTDLNLDGNNESIGIDFFALGLQSVESGSGTTGSGTTSVPEPSSYVTSIAGLLLMWLFARRRRAR